MIILMSFDQKNPLFILKFYREKSNIESLCVKYFDTKIRYKLHFLKIHVIEN